MDSKDLFYLVDAELAKEFWELIADREAWIRFAELTQDSNPLHRDPFYAIKKGFNNTIAPGMYSAAFVSAVYQTLGKTRTTTHSFEFKEPVYHGESLIPLIYSEDSRESYSVNCVSAEPEKTVLEGRIGFPPENHPGNPVELPPWNHGNSARFEYDEYAVLDYLVSFGVPKVFAEFPEGVVPDMFVGACFSGLMLNEAGDEGVYRTLDLEVQRPIKVGESLVLASRMGEIREKMGVRTCKFALAAYTDSREHELVAHGVSKGFLKS